MACKKNQLVGMKLLFDIQENEYRVSSIYQIGLLKLYLLTYIKFNKFLDKLILMEKESLGKSLGSSGLSIGLDLSVGKI